VLYALKAFRYSFSVAKTGQKGLKC